MKNKLIGLWGTKAKLTKKSVYQRMFDIFQ
jgi:hypothetical protein